MRKITDEERIVAYFTSQPVEAAAAMFKLAKAILRGRSYREPTAEAHATGESDDQAMRQQRPARERKPAHEANQ